MMNCKIAEASYAVLSLLALVFCSCGEEAREKPVLSPQEIKEPLIRENIRHVNKESDEIEQYIKYRGWEMQGTGSGLRYRIYKKSPGEKAQPGKIARVNYKVSLLDGTLCYTSEGEPREFMIGQDHIESGVHEGVLLMNTGERAVFIIPSHLAHGLMGDAAKIPPRSTIVVDLELVSLR